MTSDPWADPLPVCDRCGTVLFIHGDTLAGDLCDLSLALDQFKRGLFPRTWWWLYDRRKR